MQDEYNIEVDKTYLRSIILTCKEYMQENGFECKGCIFFNVCKKYKKELDIDE